MISNYRYLKRIFLSVHSLIGVQWLETNCQIKHVRYIEDLLRRTVF